MPGPTAFRRSRPAMLPALLVLAALAAAPAGPAGAEEMPGRLVARSWGQITGTAIAGRVTTIDLGLSPGATVDILPIFETYDRGKIGGVAQAVADLLQDENGLETLLGLIKEAATEPLYETVYALACDIAAADGQIQIEEMRLLEMFRYTLDIERLVAAAIERGSRARHMRLA